MIYQRAWRVLTQTVRNAAAHAGEMGLEILSEAQVPKDAFS